MKKARKILNLGLDGIGHALVASDNYAVQAARRFKFREKPYGAGAIALTRFASGYVAGTLPGSWWGIQLGAAAFEVFKNTNIMSPKIADVFCIPIVLPIWFSTAVIVGAPLYIAGEIVGNCAIGTSLHVARPIKNKLVPFIKRNFLRNSGMNPKGPNS